MDELVKFLTSKIGYTLVFALCIFLPGNLFIFIWNREVYLELDIIRLIMLSIAIPCVAFVLFLGITINGIVLLNMPTRFDDCLLSSAVCTFFSVNGISYMKLIGRGIKNIVFSGIKNLVIVLVISTLINVVRFLRKKSNS